MRQRGVYFLCVCVCEREREIEIERAICVSDPIILGCIGFLLGYNPCHQ